MKTLAILGGGASGLISAIETARLTKSKLNIVILERMDRVGKKLLATGNGRCNFSNSNTAPYNFHGKNPSFVNHALEEFTVDYTVNFFNQLGIFPKEELEGKLYPFSDQASSILDALRNEVEHLGIQIKTNFDVKSITYKNGSFRLTSQDNSVVSSNLLIMSAGGCASPALGSNGSGFKLLQSLGHSITKLSPALVQLRTNPKEVKSLQGIKFTGSATLIDCEVAKATEYGEVLFTDYGLSGPPIFQLSTLIPSCKKPIISLDFMPEYNIKDIYDILAGRKLTLAHLTMEQYFNGLFNKRIGNIIAKRSGIEKLSLPISALTKDMLWSIASLIKDYRLDITGTQSYNNAQVTAGGVKTNEFNPNTMQSLLIKGLYCTGEIYDIYGDCGGYNLQWAWSSGLLAAHAIAESIEE